MINQLITHELKIFSKFQTNYWFKTNIIIYMHNMIDKQIIYMTNDMITIFYSKSFLYRKICIL